ncbi:hypothetical protein GCM10017687_07270 [Streptomyces echinatus]
MMASIAGGDADVRHQQAEVVQGEPAGLVHRHGVGGGGGLEADREEDDLAVRVPAGEFEGVER